MDDRGEDGFIGSGDDLARTTAGREREPAESQAAEESDSMSADRVPAAGAGTADAGSPGGMGGVRGGMSNPDRRPNGGVSPVQGSGDEDRD